MDALDHVRRGLLQVADDAPVRAVVVDLRADEVAGEEVAHDPQRKLRLLVDERRRGGALGLRLDRLPEALEEHEVALDVLRRRALGRRADDDAAALRVEVLDDLLEPRALGVLEPPRDARALAVRDVDEEAAGQRDLGRQARALRLHRILDRLHEDRLAALDQILDLRRALPALELRADDLVDVEEAVLLEPDLDERRLHPRKDVVDDAEVDVPGDRAPLGPLEVDLGDAVVLEDRDPLLADVDGDEQLALRRRKRRALASAFADGRRATSSGRAACAPAFARADSRLGPSPSRRRGAAVVAAALGLGRRLRRPPAAGFFLPRPPRLPRRRLFFGPVRRVLRVRGLRMPGLRRSLRWLCWCCNLLEPRPLPSQSCSASCQSETSVVPRLNLLC